MGVEPTSEKFIHGPFAESLCFPSRAGFPRLSRVSHSLLPRTASIPAGCIGAQCWKWRRYEFPHLPRTQLIRHKQGELSLARDARALEVPGPSIKPRQRPGRRRWCCWRLNFAPPVKSVATLLRELPKFLPVETCQAQIPRISPGAREGSIRYPATSTSRLPDVWIVTRCQPVSSGTVISFFGFGSQRDLCKHSIGPVCNCICSVNAQTYS